MALARTLSRMDAARNGGQGPGGRFEYGSAEFNDEHFLKDVQQARETCKIWRSTMPAAPGSELQADFDLLGAASCGAVARELIHAAVDAIESLLRLVDRGESNDPRYVVDGPGNYTLMRAALEAASQALWALESTKRRTRRLRALQLWREDVKNLSSFLGETKKVFTRVRRWDLESIGWEENVRLARPSPEEFQTKDGRDRPVKSSNILRTVQKHGTAIKNLDGSPTDFTWLAAWQICSGFAHGKAWARGIFTDREVIGAADGGSQQERSKPQLFTFLVLFQQTMTLLEAAMTRYAVLGELHRTERATHEDQN